MFSTLCLTTALLASPPMTGQVQVASAEAKPQAIVASINSLLADPEFHLFQSVFPQDANEILMVLAPPGFTDCLSGALATCGQGHVCSFCYYENPNTGETICSFVCGNPGEPMGCPGTTPPCGPKPPTPDPGVPTGPEE